MAQNLPYFLMTSSTIQEVSHFEIWLKGLDLKCKIAELGNFLITGAFPRFFTTLFFPGIAAKTTIMVRIYYLSGHFCIFQNLKFGHEWQFQASYIYLIGHFNVGGVY